MITTTTSKSEPNAEHTARAIARNVHISWKHGIEISRELRFHSTEYAKKFLQGVAELKKPVPFRRYWRDVGHKPGMSAGRYPQKAAREFLQLIKAVEANAQVKGLNTASLKIIKLITNRAPKAPSAGRKRHTAKHSHLEIEVREGTIRKVAAEKKKVERPAKAVAVPLGEKQ